MEIYALSDLHLSFGVKDKPMDIFGDKWSNYEEKIKKNWNQKVKEDDVVIIAGDISWAMYLEESLEDFKYLDSLNGTKIILKGNHDYWWTTVTKMNNFLEENNINNIKFLYNNSIETSKYMICGTRYWSYDEDTEDNQKVFNRELERAKLSLEDTKNKNDKKEIVFVTHYPPDENIIECVKKYNVKYWIYGHIHSNYEENFVKIDEIKTFLTSCDYLDFNLIKIN